MNGESPLAEMKLFEFPINGWKLPTRAAKPGRDTAEIALTEWKHLIASAEKALKQAKNYVRDEERRLSASRKDATAPDG